jgi:hypothetical protein
VNKMAQAANSAASMLEPAQQPEPDTPQGVTAQAKKGK